MMAACQGNGHEPGGIRNSLCYYSSERRLESVTRVAQSNAELKEQSGKSEEVEWEKVKAGWKGKREVEIRMRQVKKR